MRLAFDDVGSGPVVVLIHGFPLDRSMWAAQVEALRSSCRVIAPDLRGFGESPATAGANTSTMDDLAGDVLELLDARGIVEPVVLGGLSMGGYVAFAALANRPERVRALILFDSRAVADTPEAAANRLVLAREVEDSGDVSQVVEGMVPRLFSPRTRERRPGLIAPVVDRMLRTSPAAVAAALRGMAARPDRTRALPAIAVPTLVVVGEDDVISTPDEARAIASAIPGGTVAIVPEAGHLAPIENPDACNAAVLAFLERIG